MVFIVFQICHNSYCNYYAVFLGFQCQNGDNTSVEDFCNGIINCEDKSDEIKTSKDCQNCTADEMAYVMEVLQIFNRTNLLKANYCSIYLCLQTNLVEPNELFIAYTH